MVKGSRRSGPDMRCSVARSSRRSLDYPQAPLESAASSDVPIRPKRRSLKRATLDQRTFPRDEQSMTDPIPDPTPDPTDPTPPFPPGPNPVPPDPVPDPTPRPGEPEPPSPRPPIPNIDPSRAVGDRRTGPPANRGGPA